MEEECCNTERLRRRYLSELSDLTKYPNFTEPISLYEKEDYENQVGCTNERGDPKWIFARYFLSCPFAELKHSYGSHTSTLLYKLLRADGAARFRIIRQLYFANTEKNLADAIGHERVEFITKFYDIPYDYLFYLITSDIMLPWIREWETVSVKGTWEVIANPGMSYAERQHRGACKSGNDSIRETFECFPNFTATNLHRIKQCTYDTPTYFKTIDSAGVPVECVELEPPPAPKSRAVEEQSTTQSLPETATVSSFIDAYSDEDEDEE